MMEAIERLNELLEAERAGVETMSRLIEVAITPEMRKLFEGIRDDEAWSCAGLANAIKRQGILSSYRGAIRGYALAKSPKEINIREVVDAIEGPGLFERCIFWDNRCGDQNPCPLHERWMGMKPGFMAMIEQTTPEDLAK